MFSSLTIVGPKIYIVCRQARIKSGQFDPVNYVLDIPLEKFTVLHLTCCYPIHSDLIVCVILWGTRVS